MAASAVLVARDLEVGRNGRNVWVCNVLLIGFYPCRRKKLEKGNAAVNCRSVRLSLCKSINLDILRPEIHRPQTRQIEQWVICPEV